ncbi:MULTISPECIES: FmdB family zinc ribbon protein [Actinomadura]|uniref:FmdB family zinc ribbon protein n=1 Tax=Actinomadura yumaensis TaxID=111807 RepID=A0ABW2CK58_9ACTN|nr:FmdB family zinc ribbon protein [Actinomadura sp. J1-007]
MPEPAGGVFVVVYEYRCPECGPFGVARPMGEAGGTERCPACAGAARRVFTAPGVRRTPGALGRALAAQEASAHEPRVVNAVPPARRRPGPAPDPRRARLPRP